uniref:Retrotransposon gag domain-containing protein n=1 Tax=Xiphophorus couchianus TaxID=32473 RepID=A0A3B5LMP7_9TELE
EGAKIAFIISLLTGQALDWAEARFPTSTDFGCTFNDFLKEFQQVCSQESNKTSNFQDLWMIKQGQWSVADFAIDFRIRVTASGWNAPALKSAYFRGLS